MISWNKFRILFLALSCGSILLVLTRVILAPVPKKTITTGFAFPEKVLLPQWQFIGSNSLPKLKQKVLEPIAQRDYQYTQNNLPLDIEMRYFTNGDVPQLIHNYTAISSPLIVRQREGIGYYGIGVDKQQAYLSACINPKGGSTFTAAQFQKNQHSEDFNPQHLVSWLLAKENFSDNHCLWTHLSVPLKDSSKEAAYEVLENAWFSWYRWWQPHLEGGE